MDRPDGFAADLP